MNVNVRLPQTAPVIFGIALAAFQGVAPVRAALPEPPPPPNEIVLVGGVDNLRHVDKQAFGTVRAQYADNFHGVRPFAQVGLAHAGSVYGGAGLLFDFPLSRRAWLTVGSGPGVYRHKGNDPDLGYAVEFASWIEVSTIVLQRRVGLTFGHLSNAHLGSRNPGTETLGLTVHFPTGNHASK
jgi:hypothetical protein